MRSVSCSRTLALGKAAQRARTLHVVLAVGAGCGLAGCASYAPRPLDLPAHREAFLARMPGSGSAEAFATGLGSVQRQSPLAFDPTDGLSLEEAEAIAMVYNADLRQARARAGVALAVAGTSGLWADPTLGVDLARIIESTPNPWKMFSSIGLTVPLSGRLRLERERAGLEHAAALAETAELEWRVRHQVRKAWAEWSAAKAKVAVGQEFVTRARDILEIVDRMERASEISRTEARLFALERAFKDAELTAATAAAARGELVIRRVLGFAPSAEVEPVASMVVAESGHDEHTRESAAVTVARTQFEVAERTLELEVSRQVPDLQVGPGTGREDGQNQVLLGLSLPLPIFNGNRRAIAEATAAREVARENAHAALERAIADIALARVRLHAATGQRSALESVIAPLVDAQYSDAVRLAGMGEVNVLVLLESLKKQHEVKVSVIEARREEVLAAIELSEVIGPPRATTERVAGSEASNAPGGATGANR